MMKKYKLISAVLALGLCMPFGLLTTSCEDMLEEKPYDFISPGEIENSDGGADMWVIGVYNVLHTGMFIYGSFPRPLDYDCDYISGAVWQFSEFGSGNFQGGSAQCNALWTGMYSLINKANQAIAQIEGMSGPTEAHKKNCLGECYFLKAWAYFYLARAYGDIPVYSVSVNESGSYTDNPRIPVQQVYEEQIIPLLDKAKDMIYKNTDGAYVPGRVSAASAAGLLAKVYATMGAASTPASEQVIVKTGVPYVIQNINGVDTKIYTDPVATTFSKNVVAGYESFDPRACYENAYQLASDVIEGVYGNHELVAYDNLWTATGKTSSEFLFSLQSLSGDSSFGTLFGLHYCGRLNNKGHVDNSLTVGMRKHWYLLFEEKDYRVDKGVLHCWIREGSDSSWGGGSYYPNFGKWKSMVDAKEPPFDNPEVTAGWRSDEGGSEQFFAYTTKYSQQISDQTLERMDANYPFLRYADVVLIKAEAANELNGPTQEAVDALNDVRSRSNATLKELDAFANKASLRSAILEERAMEFALEGDRRGDLIRWGIYLQAMNALGGMDEANNVKARQEKHLLFPIPTMEMLTNQAITSNNPGWN